MDNVVNLFPGAEDNSLVQSFVDWTEEQGIDIFNERYKQQAAIIILALKLMSNDV